MPGAQAVVVLVTTNGQEEAERLSRLLLEARLCACVSILPQVTSLYRWQGDVERQSESLLVIKTAEGALAPLVDFIKRHHDYQVPEIIALPVVGGSSDYLAWLVAETGPRPTP